MSKVFDFSGSDDFFRGGSIYQNPKESNHFLSLGHHVDVYFPPCKRSRVTAPFVFNDETFGKKQPSIEILPDECLFEIFRRLPGGQEKISCASVSKRWLMLLSNIHGDEILKTSNPGFDKEKESDGFLSRCLEGKKATDVRLAAIAVGTSSHGGLGKLSIRRSNVTNHGLKAISRGCPSLRVLSLWNVSSIGDEGLIEIAKGCQLLEKLDLSKCPGISNKGLLAIAKGCPNLSSITLESCSNIGNETLQAIGRCCPNLNSLSIKNCLLIGDQGIANLLSSPNCGLTTVKLEGLNISDVSLAVLGHYGKEITDLALVGLQNVSEKGFWVMGNGKGLQKLKSLTVTSCHGVTDLGVEAMGKGCPNLKQFCLRKCAFLSDSGLVSFVKNTLSLESLQLQECHRITQSGFFGVLVNGVGNLKSLSMENCFGIKDSALQLPSISICKSLRYLSVCNCPGFGNASLNMLGKLCPQLQHLELSGLPGITDEGFLPLIEIIGSGLAKVNLSGCVNLTDKSVSTIANVHGCTLEQLNLDGCRYLTDASLVAIAENCIFLSELDVSKCAITDSGIKALACGGKLNLRVLSLSGCCSVSGKSLPFLGKLGETLVGLNIQNCPAMSTRAVDLLVDQLWRCDILF